MTETPPGSSSEPPRTTQALFLERRSYRRRRLVDLARLLPLLGALMLLVPLLWPGSDQGATSQVITPMSTAMTYVFSVWAVLIIGAFLFGLATRRWGGETQQPNPEE